MAAVQSRAFEGCDDTPMHGDAGNNSQGKDDEDRNLNKAMATSDDWIKVTYKRRGLKSSLAKTHPRVSTYEPVKPSLLGAARDKP